MNRKSTHRPERRSSEKILDEYLVLGAQSGDSNALRELVSAWQGRLLAYALNFLNNPSDAQDAVQECLLHLSKKISQLNDPAAFPAWVYRILHCRCTDILRQQHKHERISWELEAVSQSQANFSPGIADIATQDERKHVHDDLDDIISQLNPMQQSLLRLVYREGFSIRESAKILGIAEGTVKSRLFNLRKKLEQSLS